MYHCMMTAFDRFNETDQRVTIAKIYLQNVESNQIKKIYRHPEDNQHC